MKETEQFCAFLIALLIAVGVFGVILAVKNNNEKTAEQPPGIIIDDYNVKRIITLKDTRRNLQWDAFEYGHSLIIIPGTEKPIKTSP